MYEQLSREGQREIREAYRQTMGENIPSNWRKSNRVTLGWRISLLCVGEHPELGLDVYPLEGTPLADHAARYFIRSYHPIENEDVDPELGR